jgi:response regulator RpfG family c-di-GMP phosphodiesterase
MTFGYRIVTATDPEEVFKLLLNTHIDAVITDYNIGQATSEEVVLSLRTLRPTSRSLFFRAQTVFRKHCCHVRMLRFARPKSQCCCPNWQGC